MRGPEANPLIDLKKLRAEMLRRSFLEFVKEMWEIVIPEKPVWGWYIEYECAIAADLIFQLKERKKKEHDFIVNVPPGTTKSTIWSVMLPAWAWAVDPTLRIMSFSYAHDVAMKLAMKSRLIIQNPRYQAYFPYVVLKKDQNNKGDYENTLNGQRFSTGIGGQATSQHFHLILGDDPLNPKMAASEADLEKANEFLDATLQTRKVDISITITVLIMQRLHEMDPTGHMLKKGGKVFHICLPSQSTFDGNPTGVKPAHLIDKYQDGMLDAKRLPLEFLKQQRASMGTANYVNQYLQQPAPAGGLIWQRWFKIVPDDKFPSEKLMHSVSTDWDLAYTEKQSNSASAWITTGKIGNNIYILEFGWVWYEFPALIRHMKSKRAPHYIESKASGKSAKQTLSQQGIIAVEYSVRGGDKVARARNATPVPESGIVYIKESDAERAYTDPRQGLLRFPNGEFDDFADVCAQALQRQSARGPISASGGDSSFDD